MVGGKGPNLFDLLAELNASKSGRLIIAATVLIPLITVTVWLNQISYRRARQQSTTTSNIIVCRPAAGWVFLCLLVGLAMIVAGLGLAICGDVDPYSASVMAFSAVFLGGWIALAVLRNRVILESDKITACGIFKICALDRNEIVAKRYINKNGWILYPRLRLKKKSK
jgi:hypothetical protein